MALNTEDVPFVIYACFVQHKKTVPEQNVTAANMMRPTMRHPTTHIAYLRLMPEE